MLQVGASLAGSMRVRASPVGHVHISIGAASVPKYEGKTDVTPKVAKETILPTQGKLVTRNIRVREIPCFEVSNGSGGQTLIIGKELYHNADE